MVLPHKHLKSVHSCFRTDTVGFRRPTCSRVDQLPMEPRTSAIKRENKRTSSSDLFNHDRTSPSQGSIWQICSILTLLLQRNLKTHPLKTPLNITWKHPLKDFKKPPLFLVFFWHIYSRMGLHGLDISPTQPKKQRGLWRSNKANPYSTWPELSYLHSLKLTANAPEDRPSQKEISIPTIHFQVRCHVSFTEGSLWLLMSCL